MTLNNATDFPAGEPEPCAEPTDNPVEMMLNRAASRAARDSQRRQQKSSERISEPLPLLADMPVHQRPVNRYLAERNCRPKSLKGYRTRARSVQRQMVALGFDPLDGKESEIDLFPWHLAKPSELNDLAQHFYEKYSTKTAQMYCGLVREILRCSRRSGLYSAKQLLVALDSLPMRGVRSTKRAGTDLSAQEIGTLLATAAKSRRRSERSRKRLRAMIAVLAGTGLRISELVELELADYSRRDRTLFLARTKTGASRVAGLPEESVALLDEWIEVRGLHEGALFDQIKNFGAACSTETVATQLSKLRTESGVEFTSHDFRRTYVTSLLRAGVDPFTVARMVGHKLVNTTLIYDRRTSAEDQCALQYLPIASIDRSCWTEDLARKQSPEVDES